MSYSRRRSKRRQITFRLGPRAYERLEKVAELFNMKPSQYVKALLYKDLGIFSEALDRRRARKQLRHANLPLSDVMKDRWEPE